MATKETYNKAREHLIKQALVPPQISFAEFENILPQDSPKSILAVANSFSYNLTEALSLASLPFRTAQSIALDSLWQRTLLSEKIRSGYTAATKDDSDLGKAVYRRAQEKFSSIVENHARTETNEEYDFLYDVVIKANSLIENGAMNEVARTVLLQAEVMIWNSLEILVKDLMEIGMNLSGKLRKNFSSSSVPAKWSLNRLTLESLTEIDFDLRSNFGTVMLANRELSDISSIKVLVSAILQHDAEVDRMLSDRLLYILSKRRHLIVHRRAKVDKKFISETTCAQSVGEDLISTPDAFENTLEKSFEVGKLLVAKVVKAI